MDSPVLYPQTSEGLLVPYTQKQYFVENWLVDPNLFTVTLRNARRQVEATINSNGGQNSKRFVPWLRMSSSEPCVPGDEFCNNGSSNLDLYYTELEFRQMQRMIRSKNARDCLYFTEPPDSTPEPGEVEAFEWAWTQTSDMVRRVYSTRVLKYTRATGPILPGGGGYVPYDTARLEFTLANPTNANEQEYIVDVKPQPVPVGGPYVYTTALVVDIELSDLGPSNSYLENNIVDLHIESMVSHSGAVGKVYFWIPPQNGPTGTTNGSWESIESPGTSNTNTYGFWAPQSADGLYRSRQFFNRGYTNIFNDTADGKNKARYKLVHTYTSDVALPSNAPFRSRYDLVQMTPIIGIDDQIGSMISQPQADTNGDGVVNEADWSTFVESWLTDEASADLNLNSEIDPEDADLFVEAYINGG